MSVPQIAVFVAEEHDPYAAEIAAPELTVERNGVIYRRATTVSGALSTWHLYAKDPHIGEATLTAAHKAYRDYAEHEQRRREHLERAREKRRAK